MAPGRSAPLRAGEAKARVEEVTWDEERRRNEDQRDERPLLYIGRIARPMGTSLAKGHIISLANGQHDDCSGKLLGAYDSNTNAFFEACGIWISSIINQRC